MSLLTGFHPLTLMVVAAAGSLSFPLAADTDNKTNADTHADTSAQAIFAGGCFWCMEPPYDRQRGVSATTSGYIGGESDNPTYEETNEGDTGHAEAVKIEYDPEQINYEQLLAIFWRNIDPFAEDQQFCDEGSQYRSAIFYGNDEQRELALASKADMEDRFGRDIATEIVPANTFWSAEEYHQNYYEKNPVRYKFYRFSCGRDGRLEEVWGEEAGGPTYK
ncbi:peptide-methionine (S)-S-oxide reductase MsrA [Halomonas llamarensis]|uniref:Peptide methionine sulfoxide reductase MsrA n=1 Tax=Halomonas llamarensis TaxID=2945104 RepID=A0ABT0SQ90_9GAMM|nr:peptide-methionine (S)-S-oxide reductase MsrA [Halomonas llamarensis]MCL7929524.1 peptide-methionine (S)-S-oxide reductase MsrA [Halomonas llamarensis]